MLASLNRLGRSGLLAVAAVAVLTAGPARAADDEAWALLAEARGEFELSPWTADFVQTYVPAGFSSGDRETGKVSLALPGSLRWDYEVPYPKVFLVHDGTAYTWNEGETAGRRAAIGPDDRRHLDLLQLDLASLKASFGAELREAEEAAAGTAQVALTPTNEDSPIRAATLRIERSSRRLVGLAWSDGEGNETEFVLSGHRVAPGGDYFAPPADLDWFDE